MCTKILFSNNTNIFWNTIKSKLALRVILTSIIISICFASLDICMNCIRYSLMCTKVLFTRYGYVFWDFIKSIITFEITYTSSIVGICFALKDISFYWVKGLFVSTEVSFRDNCDVFWQFKEKVPVAWEAWGLYIILINVNLVIFEQITWLKSKNLTINSVLTNRVTLSCI